MKRGQTGSEEGQATVELALLLPMLVLLALVLVEIGGIATDRVRVWHAAREAARVAIVDDDPVAIQDAADHSGLPGITVQVDPSPEDRVQGEPLTVHVAYRVEPSVPVVGAIFSGRMMEAAATMRIEQP